MTTQLETIELLHGIRLMNCGGDPVRFSKAAVLHRDGDRLFVRLLEPFQMPRPDGEDEVRLFDAFRAMAQGLGLEEADSLSLNYMCAPFVWVDNPYAFHMSVVELSLKDDGWRIIPTDLKFDLGMLPVRVQKVVQKMQETGDFRCGLVKVRTPSDPALDVPCDGENCECHHECLDD